MSSVLISEDVNESARGDAAYEGLWRPLPSSNTHKQKKLAGWSDAGEAAPAGEGIERRIHWLDDASREELRAFLDGHGYEINTVLLGACHLVLQGSLDDFESLLGCCLLEPRSRGAAAGAGRKGTLRPSYVYAEDEEPIEGFLHEIGRQLRSGPSVETEPGPSPGWGTKRAPVFFYVGVDGLCGPGGDLAEVLQMGLPERRVVIAAGADAQRVGVGISMPADVARAIGLDGFQQKFLQALSLLVAGRCQEVGEIRARLGEAPAGPDSRLAEMEKRVISLWARVIGLPEEALDGSSVYFEVGGTSLNAFKLVNLVRLELQRDLSIRDIIENPTVRGLASVLLRD